MSDVDRNGDGYIDMWVGPTEAVAEQVRTAGTNFESALKGAPATNTGIGAGPLGTAFKVVIGKPIDETKDAGTKVPPIYFTIADLLGEAVHKYVAGDSFAAAALATDGDEA
ncbi:hypothetical protein ACQEVZ_45625 [Dactylosporangium sp. CA-152071]|uniref:hypothetical protein n=1 Tax=Dactylosporangium sp. CA-152071 TaxID=3239933 RepID=UPI003D8A0A77